jgi:hypothetical protein
MNFKALPADLLPFFKIEIVTGYHGNQLRWFDELLGGPGARNQSNPRLLNLASAGYILIPSNQQMPDGYFGDKPVTELASFGQAKLLKNENALPRVFLANKFRVYENRSDIYPLILEGDEDLSEIVYLEKEPSLPLAADSMHTDSAWIENFGIDSVEIRLHCTSNRLLVLTDNFYDAWHVSVDGRPVELLRAYGTFRAVEVPAGAERVLFWYHSERYATGKTVTWLTLIYVALVMAGYALIRWRRGRKKEEATV